MSDDPAPERRRRGGRPPGLTPEIVNKAIPLLQQGHIIATVCLALGISETSFYKWQRRGQTREKARKPKDEDRLYVEFAQAIKSSRALCEIDLLGKVQKSASNGNARAAAWLLERLFPQRYRQRIGINGTPENEGPPLPAPDAPAPVLQIIFEGSAADTAPGPTATEPT